MLKPSQCIPKTTLSRRQRNLFWSIHVFHHQRHITASCTSGGLIFCNLQSRWVHLVFLTQNTKRVYSPLKALPLIINTNKIQPNPLFPGSHQHLLLIPPTLTPKTLAHTHHQTDTKTLQKMFLKTTTVTNILQLNTDGT